jgi:hypothetical protein
MRLLLLVAKTLFFLGAISDCLMASDLNGSTNKMAVPAPFFAPTHVAYICSETNAEPIYQGLPIGQWLQTNTKINTGRLSLAKMLTLKQVSTPDMWGIVRFEIPVCYDAVKASVMGGGVDLGGYNQDGEYVGCSFSDTERSTNGNCIIWWNINYDTPGKHTIYAKLNYYNGLEHIEVLGPPFLYNSSNVCQFFEGYSLFNSTGALLQAKLREQNAKYRIELTTPKGKHLKSISGNSTNGVINLEWNLKNDHGQTFKGDSFESAFYVVYPDDTHTNAPARDTFNRVGDPTN